MRNGLTLLLACSSLAQADLQQTLETDVAVEARLFTETAAYANQTDDNLSLTLSPEWYLAWGDQSITVNAFGRWDSADDDRNHGDLRELHWQGVFGSWEIRAGASRVFWGKTESLHLVDVINQDDALENIDGEDKLGQPMLRINRVLPFGSAQLYVLPYFRERQFPGEEGRLRASPVIDEDGAVYESGAEEQHVDWALRLDGWAGGLDYGLSWFSGTQRDPKFLPGDYNVDVAPTLGNTLFPFLNPLLPGVIDPQFSVELLSLFPYYGLMDQLGLDAQYTTGAWLWKLEALWREEDNRKGSELNPTIIAEDQYTAAAAGLEYTFYGVFDSAVDVGMLVEYLWEEDGLERGSAFQNDVFIATRIAANDVADTALLAGAAVDLDNDSQFFNVEFSRRIGNSSKLSIEARVFHQIADSDVFSAIAKDDYLQLTYNLYF